MPAGHGDGNPAELLGHRLFGALLARLAQHYDRVLVDSPPIGCMADARIIAAHCQATILVVRPGVCTYEALRCARESLIHVGDRLVGSVINGTGRGTKGSYSYAPWMGGPRRQGDGRARGCPGISLLSAGPAVAAPAARSEQRARAKTPADGVRVQAGRPVAGPGSEASTGRGVRSVIQA